MVIQLIGTNQVDVEVSQLGGVVVLRLYEAEALGINGWHDRHFHAGFWQVHAA